MKAAALLAVTAAALLPPAVAALHLQKRQDGAPRVVSMDMQRKTVADPIKRDRVRRRATTVLANLENEETLYFVNATLGTPAQSFRLQLDTGSSDLWVNSPNSTLCEGTTQPCKYAGTYDANASSTYEYVGDWFNITYLDGSGASGDYATDTITIGGQTLDQLQFGIGYTSGSSQGILGIGYPANEVQVGTARMSPYKNLPAKMVDDGLIQSSAYSLWLNDLDSSTGSILFGGVDSAKYSGTLQTLPIQSDSGVYAEFLITLTSISLDGQTVAGNVDLDVLLDTGSSLTYLPDAVAQDVFTAVGAQYVDSDGAAYVPCALAREDRNLTFAFASAAVSVGMDELVLDIGTSAGQRLAFAGGEPACLFGVSASGSTPTTVFGDTFLRSAYVVYDLANNEISLAQTRFNASGSSILEIGTGSAAVPGATPASGSSSPSASSSSSSKSDGAAGNAAASPARAGVAAAAAAVAFAAGLLTVLA